MIQEQRKLLCKRIITAASQNDLKALEQAKKELREC